MIKRPDILVLGDALAVFDAATQARLLDGLRREFAGRGLVVTLDSPEVAKGFETIIVMREGRIVRQENADRPAGEPAPATPAMSAAD